MSSKGDHTWNLVLHYHKCPQCGFIIESRKDFVTRAGKRIKKITCDRCGNSFTITKTEKPSFGPLIGDPQPKEIDWS